MNSLAPSQELALLDQLVARPDGRGRAAQPLLLEPIRELSLSDIKDLLNAPAKPKPPSVKQLRHSHHLLARLIAEGVPQAQISLMTGYDPARISVLKNSPTFEELISFYESQELSKDLDFRKRMADFALDCVGELHSRLEEHPETITNKELLAAAELGMNASGLVGQVGGKVQGGAGAGVNLTVQFVSPQGPSAAPGPVFDGTAERVA